MLKARTTLRATPVFLTLLLASCSSTTSTPVTTTITGPTLAAGGASALFVSQQSSPASTILQFSATTNGSVSPTQTLTLPLTVLVNSLALDAAGQLYVGALANSAPEILVYAPGATGTATPIRTILGTPTSFDTPQALAIDTAGNLYVYGQTLQGRPPSVSVFGPTATGAATPTRVIVGTATLLDYGFGLAVDKAGTLYVADTGGTGSGQILAFAPTANGNAAPTRTITGPLGQTYGIDTDSTGNLYVLTYTGGATPVPTIVEFSPTASGVATPIRTIAGSNTGLSYAAGIRVDAAGNIYVDAAGNQFLPYIAGFGATQTGNVAPAVTISSSAWTSAGQHALAVK